MYSAHTDHLPFKEKYLRSQVTTFEATLACTSDQFCSSWRPGPNHTARILMGLSLQQKGPDRGTPPLHAPNHKPSLLSKLILSSAICSYIATAFFTVLCPDDGTKRQWYHQRTRMPLLKESQQKEYRAGSDFPRHPFAKLRLESGSFQNRRHEPMVNPI